MSSITRVCKRILRPLIPSAVYRRRRMREHEQWLMDGDQARFNLGKANERWRQRIADVIAAPDNAFISRLPEAG